ncbi:MAG: ComEC/Rec2 family competence protein [Solirubrobacterales bacterium]
MNRVLELLEPVRAGGWRLALVTGLAAGLALAPHWTPRHGAIEAAIALLLILIVLVDRGRLPAMTLILIFAASLFAGNGLGGQRLEAIDAGALRAAPGTPVKVSGFTTAEAKTSRGITRIPVQAKGGKLMVEYSGHPLSLDTGDSILAIGQAGPPPDWYRSTLERQGIATVVTSREVKLTGDSRSGPAGWIDALRRRAEDALQTGMPDRESALARGFVLGQDGEIDPETTENFQDSGLAHLLAVSGQNVVLLGLLAIPFMAMAGLGPRARIGTVALLILVYVPLAGAGASIQRAAVMGLAGLVATLASRPGSRLYALVLAVLVTMAINPRAGSDIGWQLSFAAVIGIYLLTRPFQTRLEGLVGEGGWRSGLATGIAVTAAATIATGPLMVFHFDRIPMASLPANLLAMPAVAPAMWLGMISAAIGQIHESLAVPFNLLNSLLLAYIAQVAGWFGRPGWAVIDLKMSGPGHLALAYSGIAVLTGLFLHRVTPERLGYRREPGVRRKARLAAIAAGAAIVAAVILLPSMLDPGRRELAEPPVGGARVEVLDIGQGDATLIRPWGKDPILVDGGPPGGDLAGALDSAGVDYLEAVVLTHGDLDHTGGLYEIFGHVEVGRFLYDGVPGDLKRMAIEAGARTFPVERGQQIEIGPVTLDVIWPPDLAPGQPRPEDPNVRSVVLDLSVDGFHMLLAGDAEHEAAPFETGPIDVLRVAHHGSDDAGLPALLAADRPEVAVISVGENNRYGHPTEAVLGALEQAGVEVYRTDLAGTVSLVVTASGYSIETGG